MRRPIKKGTASTSPVEGAPTIERRRQARTLNDSIERVHGRELIDTDGRVSTPFRVVDTLELMNRAGSISPEMWKVGVDFRDNFARAQLDTLKAADMERSGGGGSSREVISLAGYRARDTVWSQITAVGGIASPGGSCLWYVLGWGKSLSEWAQTQGWAGRMVSPKQASGILVAVLGMLVSQKTHPG